MAESGTAEKTLEIDADTVPYVALEGGLEFRLLQVRPEERLVVSQVRAAPNAVSRLHRHRRAVYGYTTRGAWGHDDTVPYRPGTYVYETPGVVHRFVNGGAETEAVFISHGDMEYLDPDTLQVADVITPEVMLEAYLSKCADAGLPRPGILR